MVRTGNVDFSCKRLTSIEIRKSKYHIIRRVGPPHPPEKDIWIRACSLLPYGHSRGLNYENTDVNSRRHHPHV